MPNRVKEESEERAPLNPFYEWIGEHQRYLRSIKGQLHPAVLHTAMRLLPGVAEMHATDRPHLCPDGEGGLSFVWHMDRESPLYGMEIDLSAPFRPADEYEHYNPWKPVHPDGKWKKFEEENAL